MLNGAGPRLIAEEVRVVALDQLQIALLLLRVPLHRNISVNQLKATKKNILSDKLQKLGGSKD